MENVPVIETPVVLLQAIANYLQTKPYQEVVGLLGELASLKPKETPVPEPSNPKK